MAAIAIPLDFVVTDAINMTGSSGDLRRAFALSEFFAHGFGVVVILITIFTLSPPHRRQLRRFILAILATSVVVHLIKNLVTRRRPETYHKFPDSVGLTWKEMPPKTAELLEAHGKDAEWLMQSFPSGHAACAICVAIGLSIMFPRGRFLFFVLAVMACLQRIMFEAHWPSDVLFGAAIATATSYAVFSIPFGESRLPLLRADPSKAPLAQENKN